MQRNVFSRMLADSDCPKCGGPVGSHSDICLDCGHDTAGEVWPVGMIFGIILLVALLVCCTGCNSGDVRFDRIPPDVGVTRQTVDGHRYLIFKFTHIHGGGVTHDPDCPKCKESPKIFECTTD